MKSLFFAFVILIAGSASARHSYYPEQYQNIFENELAQDQQLKQIIHTIQTSKHTKRNGLTDELGCKSSKTCYQRRVHGYKQARTVLFGEIALRKNNGGYFIKDVYCNKVFTRSQTKLGPGKIPNPNVLNCEHTWPKYRFNKSINKKKQLTDLHHLYPTDSKANSIRGHALFDDFAGAGVKLSNCSSYTESTSGQSRKFEPPAEHKGNVARALFYFAVQYNLEMDDHEEAVMRQWHILDPVDEDEYNRNEIIYNFQKNRNTFIDYPELVHQINDF